MIINLKQRKDITKWHDWFAWRPVIVEFFGTEDKAYTVVARKFIWLETVERVADYHVEGWFYRLKEPKYDPV